MNHRAEEPVARYLAALEPPLLRSFDLLAGAPKGAARLRELILSLAVRGKLVPQDPSDEPASVLLERIRVEKARLVREGKSRVEKPSGGKIADAPYVLPSGWNWSTIGDLISLMGSGWSPACLDQPQHTPNQWAVLKTTAVQLMSYQCHQNKRLPEKLQPRPELEVMAGDILITRAGPKNRVGICCLVEQTPTHLMLSDKIVRFHLIDEVLDPRFIVLCLNAGWSFEQIEHAKTGMAESQVNISQADIRSIVVPICSKAEQTRIVARVEALMRLCDELEAKGRLEAEQHARLVGTLFETLAASESAHALAENWQRIAAHFDLLLDRPEAVDALEQTILQLAVRGLLVPQDPADEPASALLEKIRDEKHRLIAAGKLKRDKPLPPIAEDEKPFELPEGWEWVRLSELLPEFQNGASSRGDHDGVPVTVLRLADIKARRISLEDTREISIKAANINKYKLANGDILIVRVNGSADIVGNFILSEHDNTAIYCDHFIRMRIDQRWMNPQYMALLGETRLVRDRISSLFITTAGQKTVNQGHIGSLFIALPPLAEQSRIVARVEQLRRLCADLRARLGEARATQSRLAETLVDQTV